MENRIPPLEDLGDLFVDRHEELAMFWDWATNVPLRPNNSFALIGRRRTGKTALLHRLFNRLFYEQEKVLPVYISFARHVDRKEPLTSYEFARDYLTGYLRSYLAFRHRDPDLMEDDFTLYRLRNFARKAQDNYALELLDTYDGALTEPIPHGVVQWAINFPKSTARKRNMPTAIIVDEFQVLTDVYDPVQNVHHDITDSFQKAVETAWAPLLVAGSAVSLLVDQALTGMLQGRFHYWYVKPLVQEHAHDLVFRLGERFGLKTSTELAEAIWQLTSGHPYAIYSLMTSLCPRRQDYPALVALEKVVIFELTDTRGKLWQHYRGEFEKYSHQLNEGEITRRVMLWATKYPDRRIDAERVAQEIGKDVKEVRTALEKLRWVDVVEKTGLISYQGPNDAMMRRYIEYQHHTEIEKLAPEKALHNLRAENKRIRGQLNHTMGEVGEMYAAMVMRGFRGQEVAGERYFNHEGSIVLPAFDKVERRGGVVEAGIPVEIDLIGEWTLPEEGGGQGAWLVQVRFTQDRMGAKAVRHFLRQTGVMTTKAGYASVTRWYVSKTGFTGEAAQILRETGVLYSDWATFHKLAKLCGFLGLPG